VAVNATTLQVKDDENAPMLWKWKVTDDRRHSRLPAMSTVDDQATAMK
jgi:hypothetical protein